MKAVHSFPALLEAPLDRASAEPLQRQLRSRLKEAIVAGQLPAGLRLPATRELAQLLLVSRNTVSIAYEHLLAEGYVLADRQGTVVAPLPIPVQSPKKQATESAPRLANRLSQLQARPALTADSSVLRPGVPALAQFPTAQWRLALAHAARMATPNALNYAQPLGQLSLRTAIASHLAMSRGVQCTAEQVVVTEGAQEALNLSVRLITNPGDTAWLEDPGYRGGQTALQMGDLRVLPKRIDAEGLSWLPNSWTLEQPRLIYTTPSHQYPLGAVMSVARRLELMAAAQAHGAWIIEDDYDSEFRHSGEPIRAMQGLMADAPVLYVGTFSKTMFPALRLGFLVLPKRLLPLVKNALHELLSGGHNHEQLAMARFMETGQFARHLARMRRLYRQRQLALRDALGQYLGIPHSIEGGRAGLHLCVRFTADYADVAVVAAAARYGMAAQALSTFALAPQAQDNGLVLGYGNTPVEVMGPMVKRLGMILKKLPVAV